MSITFSGLATGLDTDKIVKDIMTLERAPLDRIEAKKTAETERLKAYAQFKTKLDELKSAAGDLNITSEVRTTKVSLSSEDAFTATTSSGALGSYNISVAQLSQVQKSITNGFSSNSESILGTGSITVNGTVITVGESNNSLLSLANSINEKSETTGVTATIINDGTSGSPYHLVFTGKDSSTNFTVTSNLADSSSNPIDFTTTDAQTARQAVVFIDGLKVVSNSNTISNAISGVTLDLNEVSKKTYDGTPEAGVDPWEWADPPVYSSTRMDIKADTDTTKEKITAFVTAYNGVMEWINSGYKEFGGSTEIPESTEEDKDPLLGAVLRGDATINSVKRQLQSILTSSIKTGGDFSSLAGLGITTNKDGTLKQNNTKLDDALNNNFDDVVHLLAGKDETDGIMKNFNSLLLDLTSATSGIYATKKKASSRAMERFDYQIDQMELRMTKRERALRAQFNAMEQMVSKLNSQGDFLTQQMNALNGMKK
ncbi:flagellar filament capping protein FliD [Desulfomarina sp.]